MGGVSERVHFSHQLITHLHRVALDRLRFSPCTYHRGQIHGAQRSLLGMATSAKGQFGRKVRKLGGVKLDMFMSVILVDIALFSQSTSAI